jgi:hypothetical protein
MGVAMRVAWLLCVLAACTTSHSVFGDPTESVCPTGSTLTYETFGQPFMESYCTRCHASDRKGADRHGAPSFHDFDTLFGIKAVYDHVDETAAAGPASTNTGMPNDSGAKPTLAERKQLGEWIACGMPSSTTTFNTTP